MITVLTNSKDDATVKLSVFTPYGSALGTKSWHVAKEPDENGDILIEVADTPSYKETVNDMLSTYGFNEGIPTSQNSTESSSTFIAKKLNRRCILQVNAAWVGLPIPDKALSLTVDQNEVKLYSSRKAIDDLLVLDKLVVISTERVEMRMHVFLRI